MRNFPFASCLTIPAIASFLTIGISMSPTFAKAQAGPSTVTIPFAFQAEQREMPAGVYQISKASDNLVLLRGPNEVATFVLVHAAIAQKTSSQGSVVFHRYGQTYFLGEFWTASTKTGAECFKSQAEKEMILASKHPVPSTITLAYTPVPR
jgi:hypothetical protein